MKKRKKKNLLEGNQCYNESDEFFYFIVGSTPGGASYGISWEQAREEGLVEEEDFVYENDWELPF